MVKRIVEKKISITKAAKESGISYGTLWNKINKQHQKDTGGQRRLTDESEAAFVRTLDTMAMWKVPLTAFDLRCVVKGYLDRQGVVDARFRNNLPGPDWVKGFVGRHNLTTRCADNVKPVRAEIRAPEIQAYFDNLAESTAGIPPSNIFNYDETNFTDNPGVLKVVVRRGVKRVERSVQHSKSAVSVMFCGSASGTFLPPMVVYKAKHVYEEWMRGGTPRAIYDCSPSGWFDARTFTRWFTDVFLPNTSHLVGRRMILGDNLASHFEPRVIALCEEHDIVFTTLLPNATHLLQPLDVSVFRPAKLHWRQILQRWRMESRSRGTLPKTQFPLLLSSLCSQLEGKNLVSGFRACGIVPLDASQVLKRIPTQNADTSQTPLLSDSVMDLLERNCGGDKAVRRKRGKKVPAPGTRVTVEDVATASTSGNVAPKRKLKEPVFAIDTNICYVCKKWVCPQAGDDSDSDAEDSWVECEGCRRWYHMACVDDVCNPCLFC